MKAFAQSCCKARRCQINLCALVARLGLAFAACGLPVTHGATRYVSPSGTNDAASGYNTLAGAATNILDVLVPLAHNDTVLVDDGRYVLTSQIAISRTNVMFKSINGRDKVIINGNYPNTTNRCFSLVGNGCVLDGFTIFNGYANTNTYGIYAGGGGVIVNPYRMEPHNAVIRNCVIVSNYAENGNNYGGSGGGVWALYIRPLSNHAVISNCVISFNMGLTNNLLAGSESHGGGVAGYVEMYDCRITDNTVTHKGAGVFGGGVFVNCDISRNKGLVVSSTQVGGGGAYLLSNAFFTNCLVANNSAKFCGGLDFRFGDANQTGGVISACTVVSNYGSLATYGGGIWIRGSYPKPIDICNSIVFSNKAGAVADDISYAATSGADTLRYSCVSTTNGVNYPVAVNCITNPPVFVDSAGGNYRLTRESPCVNAGINENWMISAMDLDGRQRIDYFGKCVDMGCYEFKPLGTMIGIR